MNITPGSVGPVSGLFQHKYIEMYEKETGRLPRAGYAACNFTSEFVKWLIEKTGNEQKHVDSAE